MQSKLQPIIDVVASIAGKLAPRHFAIRGSANLALQGLKVDTDGKDIDIVCDRQTAIAFNQVLPKTSIIQPVRFVASPRIQSFFGQFLINGRIIEVMGNFQLKGPCGRWSPVFTAKHHTQYQLNRFTLPLTPLEKELEMYYWLGRWRKRWLIISHLISLSGSAHPPSPFWHKDNQSGRLAASFKDANQQLNKSFLLVEKLLSHKDKQIPLVYHNKAHTLNVLDRLNLLLKIHRLTNDQTRSLLRLAALFHDFSPHTYNPNPLVLAEFIAATEADLFARRINLSLTDRLFIQEAILSTRFDTKPLLFEGLLLHAADLAGFIKPWEGWLQESSSLIQEMSPHLKLRNLSDWQTFSLNFLHRAYPRIQSVIPPAWQKAWHQTVDNVKNPTQPRLLPALKKHIIPLLK
ncbi:MAG: hypothetical protein GXP43_01265 [bacterium]|nr:hypothetical protein [bacterium]